MLDWVNLLFCWPVQKQKNFVIDAKIFCLEKKWVRQNPNEFKNKLGLQIVRRGNISEIMFVPASGVDKRQGEGW